MKNLAVASDILHWDEVASNLDINGLGDSIPPNIPQRNLLNDLACHVREISALNMYGVHEPDKTLALFRLVMKRCDCDLDELKLDCFFRHSPEPDGWGDALSLPEYQEWMDAL